jgi:hypothetical protein
MLRRSFVQWVMSKSVQGENSQQVVRSREIGIENIAIIHVIAQQLCTATSWAGADFWALYS